MPTQEEINAANVELQVANDNYAALQSRLDKYNQAFKTYANLSPEQQQNPRLREAMTAALNDYNNLKVQQLANEDRIAAAQNTVNNYNAALTTQPQTVSWHQRRRTVAPTVVQDVVTPAPQTVVPTASNINTPSSIYRAPFNRQPVQGWGVPMAWGMSTAQWPRAGYVTQNTQPTQYMTPMTDMVWGMSTPNGIAIGSRARML